MTPLTPPTDLELVAHAGEAGRIVCRQSRHTFIEGKTYACRTVQIPFLQRFDRSKPHLNTATKEMYVLTHDCELSGSDIALIVTDDSGQEYRFMHRPTTRVTDLPEKELFEIFRRPAVQAFADLHHEQINVNLSALVNHAARTGFEYLPGQLHYIARMAVQDYGYIAAAVGAGKSLMALSLVMLKEPQRALIIVPQGTLRTDVDDEEQPEFSVSQWVGECRQFLPKIPVHELYTFEDYQMLKAGSQHLPDGIYLTYPQAMFQNGAMETRPAKLPEDDWRETIGTEVDGIRCIAQPCLATLIGHEFDCVIVDEAQTCFPKNTLVNTDIGVVTIGEIVNNGKASKVISSDSSGNVRWDKIVNRFKHKTNNKLVKITHEFGTIICTEDHKVFTKSGETTNAILLRPGTYLRKLREHIHEECKKQILFKEMFEQKEHVKSGSCFENKNASRKAEGWNFLPRMSAGFLRYPKQGSSKKILQPEVLNETLVANRKIYRKNSENADLSCCCSNWEKESFSFSKNEGEKSNEESSFSGKDEEIPIWKNVLKQGWERENNSSTKRTGVSPDKHGCGNGICDNNQQSIKKCVQIPSKSLQGGHSDPVIKTSNRNRWEQPQNQKMEIFGQEENRGVEFSRVVSVEILEQGSNDWERCGYSKDPHVYCIEVEQNHNFFANGILVSNCNNPESNLTQMLLRMQPRLRYALSATPVHNSVGDLFPLMGWLCVPDWYRGGISNEAWPYHRSLYARFLKDFGSIERDLTQEMLNRQVARKSKVNPVVKPSPVISNPARLLRIIKPTLGYISKRDCKPDLPPAHVRDIRVPFGTQQMALYHHFLNRANIDEENPLIRARKQLSYLRKICADPAGFKFGGPKVLSNLNPKTLAVMALVKEILGKGDPVVIISARVGQTNTFADLLDDMHVPYSRIDSTRLPTDHAQEAHMFKAGVNRVCLFGIKCSASYSFSNCPHEIITSLEYSNGSYEQATGRVDRVNSPKPPNIYCVLIRHSYEELMRETISIKNDSALLCLLGERMRSDMKTIDASEILAESMSHFRDAQCVDELSAEPSALHL